MSNRIIITIGTSEELQKQTFNLRRDNQGAYHYAFGHGITPASVSYFVKASIRKKLKPIVILSNLTENKEEIIKILTKLEVEYYESN